MRLTTSTEAYNAILCTVDCTYGAPMGRPNVIPDAQKSILVGYTKFLQVFDRKVHLNAQGYDQGGAYWGIGGELRVSYTRDRSYVKFYRKIAPKASTT